MLQAEAGESRVEPRARLRQITPLLDNPWLLNGYTGVGEEGQYFYVTYVSRPYSWHRLNILVKRAREKDSTRHTIDTKIAAATAVSPADGSRMIYGYVCSLLQDGIFGNKITKLVISNDVCGELDIKFSSDTEELARISSLNDQHIAWKVPIVKKIMYTGHTGPYTYKVSCKMRPYSFHQIPDAEALDNFVYELYVLNSTIHCPYLSNLAYIVYDEREQYIRGYLLDEQLGRESL